MSRMFVVMLALMVPLASAALGQTRYGSEEDSACRRDAARFCKGMSEEFRVRDCLVAQKARISHRCRTVLESHGY